MTLVVDYLGDAIRHHRKLAHLDGLGLAVLADISQKHLSQIETGKVYGSIPMLEHLADCIGVPLSEVVRTAESYREAAS